MRLTVLGCRAGMPADGQASSGYLLDTGTARILLDCGPGVATALSAVTDRPDAVVISHMHLDHCYDLLPLGKTILAPVAHLGAELRSVPLLVPQGATRVLQQLAALFPVRTFPLLDRAFDLAFDVREYRPGDELDVCGARLSTALLTHSAPNCGLRISADGASTTYSGDTGPTPALAELARGTDLLLCESTLDRSDDGAHGHLSAADAGRAAADAAAGTLVLTHHSSAEPGVLRSRVEQAAAVFDGPVHLAAPGAVFDVEPAPASDVDAHRTAVSR